VYAYVCRITLVCLCVQALRRYLLLGQGDFINHLMDLMV